MPCEGLSIPQPLIIANNDTSIDFTIADILATNASVQLLQAIGDVILLNNAAIRVPLPARTSRPQNVQACFRYTQDSTPSDCTQCINIRLLPNCSSRTDRTVPIQPGTPFSFGLFAGTGDIVAANPGLSPSKLRVGQSITLP